MFLVMDVSHKHHVNDYASTTNRNRHVILPADLARAVPRAHLMSETEWRNLGVQQSPGWVHYMLHAPEPHVLLFRRPRPSSATSNAAVMVQSTLMRA